MNSGFSIWSLQPSVFNLLADLPSHAVGGGSRSGFGSTFFQAVKGGFGSGSRDQGVGISVFSLGFASQCSVPIRSELGGHALHGCLYLDPSLFEKLRIGVFRQFSEWRMFFTPSAIIKASVSDLLFSTPSTMVPAPATAD